MRLIIGLVVGIIVGSSKKGASSSSVVNPLVVGSSCSVGCLVAHGLGNTILRVGARVG